MNVSPPPAPLEVKVWGKMACFTRPENKVERVSYPVMTPSAARGVLEAIFWKPEFSYRIRQIAVLSPIRYMAILRNEVNSKASAGSRGISVTDDRAQRHSLILTSGGDGYVEYVVRADVVLKAGVQEHPAKYRDQFRRRVERGQCYHRPYLGCREFSCDFAEPSGRERCIDESRDLGLMLFDIAFGLHPGRPNVPLFFAAGLQQGVVDVPDMMYENLEALRQ